MYDFSGAETQTVVKRLDARSIDQPKQDIQQKS